MAGFGILLETAGGSGEPVGGLASASRGHARPWPAAASSGRSLSWGGLPRRCALCMLPEI